MKRIKTIFFMVAFVPLLLLSWTEPSCRNTSGGSPEQPTTIYLGDSGTFGHDSWADVDTKWPKWRIVIDQDASISDGSYGSWSSHSNSENKTNTSPTFTATGTWYWSAQVEYTDAGGMQRWYCRDNSSWYGMWVTPTSDLTITVSQIPI